MTNITSYDFGTAGENEAETLKLTAAPELKRAPWAYDLVYVQCALREMMNEIRTTVADRLPRKEIEERKHQDALHARLFGAKDAMASHLVSLSTTLLRFHEHDFARHSEAPPVSAPDAPLSPEDVNILGQYLTGEKR